MDEVSEVGRVGGEGGCISLFFCVWFGVYFLVFDGFIVGLCGCVGIWGEVVLEVRVGGIEFWGLLLVKFL